MRKIFTDKDLDEEGNVRIKLQPSDTINVLPGKYYYEIKACTFDKGEAIISTVVDKTKFLLL